MKIIALIAISLGFVYADPQQPVRTLRDERAIQFNELATAVAEVLFGIKDKTSRLQDWHSAALTTAKVYASKLDENGRPRVFPVVPVPVVNPVRRRRRRKLLKPIINPVGSAAASAEAMASASANADNVVPVVPVRRPIVYRS